MSPRFPLAIAVCLALSGAAWAADPAPPRKASKAKLVVPKVDLSGLGALPAMDGVQGERDGARLKPRADGEALTFEVLAVEHARDFNRTAKGYAPAGELLRSVSATGSPPTTPPFATHVRVRASRETRASIEIAILDPARDVAMSGEGQIHLRGQPAEGDWVLLWDPTPRVKGGTYQVRVSVGGRSLGTWPLEIAVER